MNNKGFMRTLEAVVAILIIFGFILFIFPKGERFEGYMPIELDRISASMMTEIQNNDAFRKCVLNTKGMIEGEQCSILINNFILNSLPPLSLWDYAFKVCDIKDNPCNGYNSKGEQLDDFDNKLPLDKSVFTKRLFVSVDDVTALPLEAQGVNLKSYQEFKIYFWEK